MSYWPLGYGYAGTYDSVQGKTLDRVACGVTPRMPSGMFYVGLSRVRRLEDFYMFANVNEFNDIEDVVKIIMRNPRITSVDPTVALFVRQHRMGEAHAAYDKGPISDLIESVPKKPTPEPVQLRCAICDGMPSLVNQPCGHLVSCKTCWEKALYEGVRTCFKCGCLVGKTIHFSV